MDINRIGPILVAIVVFVGVFALMSSVSEATHDCTKKAHLISSQYWNKTSFYGWSWETNEGLKPELENFMQGKQIISVGYDGTGFSDHTMDALVIWCE